MTLSFTLVVVEYVVGVVGTVNCRCHDHHRSNNENVGLVFIPCLAESDIIARSSFALGCVSGHALLSSPEDP